MKIPNRCDSENSKYARQSHKMIPAPKKKTFIFPYGLFHVKPCPQKPSHHSKPLTKHNTSSPFTDA